MRNDPSLTPNVDQVLRLVERVALALVTERDQFEFGYAYERGTLMVKMKANLADVKRLVGKNGTHISALLTVAWTVGTALGVRSIEIDRISIGQKPEAPFIKFNPKPGVSLEPIVDLVSEVVETVWPQQCDIGVRDRSNYATDIIVQIGADHDNVIENLSHALRSLFMTAGINIGRLCYVTVEGNSATDWREADAARRATRSIHVSGSVADKGESEISRKHRGELGKRKMHMHGFRGQKKSSVAKDWRPGREE